MMSIKHEIDVGVVLQRLDAGAAVVGVDHLDAVRLEDAGHGEDVAHVIVDDQDLLTRRRSLRPCGVSLIIAFDRSGSRSSIAMQEERGVLEQPLRRVDAALEDDRLRVLLQPLLLVVGQLLAGVDDDRQVAIARLRLDLLDQAHAVVARQHQIDDHAVELAGVERRQRLLGRAHGRDLDVVALADQLDDALALVVVVLDQQQLPHRSIEERRDVLERRLQRLAADRLLEVGERAQRGAAPRELVDRDHVHRDVARAARCASGDRARASRRAPAAADRG